MSEVKVFSGSNKSHKGWKRLFSRTPKDTGQVKIVSNSKQRGQAFRQLFARNPRLFILVLVIFLVAAGSTYWFIIRSPKKEIEKPNPPQLTKELNESLTKQAEAIQQAGPATMDVSKLDSYIQFILAAGEKDPKAKDNATYNYNLAIAFYRSGDKVKSLEYLDKAIDIAQAAKAQKSVDYMSAVKNSIVAGKEPKW